MRYEFQCKKCKNIFTEERKLKDNTDHTKCLKCGENAEKIASIFGFKIIGYSSLNGYSSGNVTR